MCGENIMARPYKPNFESEEDLIYLYKELFMNTGFAFNSQSLGISYADFIKKKFFLPFDLSPDQCNFNHIHPTRNGDVGVELSWSKQLEKPITMIVYLVYDRFVRINNYNQVSLSP